MSGKVRCRVCWTFNSQKRSLCVRCGAVLVEHLGKPGNSGDTVTHEIRGCQPVQFAVAADNSPVLSASATKGHGSLRKILGGIVLG